MKKKILIISIFIYFYFEYEYNLKDVLMTLSDIYEIYFYIQCKIEFKISITSAIFQKRTFHARKNYQESDFSADYFSKRRQD